MGQYFKIVNPVKKQYIDAIKFNEGIKSDSVLYGDHSIAVALLVSNMDQVRDGFGNLLHSYGPLAGSWCGDPVIVAGDYAEANTNGIKTSSERNPDRNLYLMAKEEFEDISYKAMAMLCEGRGGFADEKAREAANSPSAGMNLVNLGNVVLTVGSRALEQALEEHYGRNWIKRYKEG